MGFYARASLDMAPAGKSATGEYRELSAAVRANQAYWALLVRLVKQGKMPPPLPK